MSATLLTIVRQARRYLGSNTGDDFRWPEAELVDIANRGIRDLWRAIQALDKDFFYTVDATNVTLTVSGATLTGVPSDVARVRGIEARDLTTPGGLTFEPLDYVHPTMAHQRSIAAAAVVANQKFYYSVVGGGAPIAAPTIYIAPKVASATLNLTLIYVPTVAEKVITDTNPIPGESDEAIVAWIVAHALAKLAATKQPDQTWLKVYDVEKTAVLDAVFERQSQHGHKATREAGRQ